MYPHHPLTDRRIFRDLNYTKKPQKSPTSLLFAARRGDEHGRLTRKDPQKGWNYFVQLKCVKPHSARNSEFSYPIARSRTTEQAGISPEYSGPGSSRMMKSHPPFSVVEVPGKSHTSVDPSETTIYLLYRRLNKPPQGVFPPRS